MKPAMLKTRPIPWVQLFNISSTEMLLDAFLTLARPQSLCPDRALSGKNNAANGGEQVLEVRLGGDQKRLPPLWASFVMCTRDGVAEKFPKRGEWQWTAMEWG